jgi:hypothetical protein
VGRHYAISFVHNTLPEQFALQPEILPAMPAKSLSLSREGKYAWFMGLREINLIKIAVTRN